MPHHKRAKATKPTEAAVASKPKPKLKSVPARKLKPMPVQKPKSASVPRQKKKAASKLKGESASVSKQTSASASKQKSVSALNKKSKTQQKNPDSIVVDLRGRKHYESLLQLLRRKVPDAPKSAFPADLKPMLATLTEAPFTDGNWQFELKLDGYRALAYLQNGGVELRSRNNLSFNKKFAALLPSLKAWPIDAVVDGEVVVLNDQGVPDFNGIQQWEKQQRGQLVFYVFDLLWLDGRNIMSEPLHLRRSLLKELVPDSGLIRFSDHIDEIGEAFFEMARKNNLEGIIAKQKDAPYIPDTRTKTWLKIKVEERHEVVICGYTRKPASDRPFSSLLLGVYRKGELVFIGQAGTGYTISMQKELMREMKPLATNACPFAHKPHLREHPFWIKPHLVGEVKYTELTDEGVMRHASFQGLRYDKTAEGIN